MSNSVDVQARNLRLTDEIKEYVNKKAGRIDHYLPAIDEASVELTHHKSARNAADRNVAQITVRGKGITLRTEERADEILAAFDAALDHLQRQIERFKGKHYHSRGDDRSEPSTLEDEAMLTEPSERQPVIVRRKKFNLFPMNEEEAIEEMNLLGHNNFFIFYNGETSKINVLYRRRDGSFGLIEPEIG